MKIIGSKCGGCCSQACTDCCTTDAPATFEVEVAMTDDECGVCDSFMSGTYVLSRIGTSCSWRYTQGSNNSNIAWCDPGCTDTASCYYIIRRELNLSIVRRAGTCYIELAILLAGRYSPSEPANPCDNPSSSDRMVVNTWYFNKALGSVTDCKTISAESLTFLSSECKCINLIIDCDPAYMRWFCDPTSITAEVTAA